MRRTAVTCQKRKYDQLSIPRREIESLLSNPDPLYAEKCRRDFSYFVKEFWSEVDTAELVWNWHIDYLSEQLTKIAKGVSTGLPKEYDLIINIPPGTTKSKLVNVLFPVWCWTNWYWMRFISTSYSAPLSLEHAESSRDLIRSEKFQQYFPDLQIKRDKDVKSNFRIIKTLPDKVIALGGSRFSTSVGGAVTGFHAHIMLNDDPLNPEEAVSKVSLEKANRFIDQTLSTRKVDKAVSVSILIMQRLHQDDPTGHALAKKKKKILHICIPGEIRTEGYSEKVQPPELIDQYTDGLMDPRRMSWEVLQDMKADLGQYGYAGQVGQDPTPPGGGMFRVDHFQMVDRIPSAPNIIQIVRYWDKAGSQNAGTYTVGVKMIKLRNGKYLISDVKRGQWSTDQRERIIKETAEADEAGGQKVVIYHEQEPGSGGKESAQATTRNLAGFSAHRDLPTGDKTFRADPYSVQVNEGNVLLLVAEWNHEFREEHRFFPFSTYKDQVDAGAGAFNKLVKRRIAGTILRKR